MTLSRSWLYVPGDDSRKLEKATSADADIVVLDLEDAVAADRKAAGRDAVRGALDAFDYGRSRRYVRLNAATTPHWRADIEATIEAGPDGYVLAKASRPDDVRRVADAIRELAASAEAPHLAVIVTEDVEGFFAAGETMVADDLVDTALWGSEDLSASIGAWTVKDADGELLDVFRTVRSMTLLAAARAGVDLIDTPYLTIGDLAGLRQEARAVARMGFAGKQAIHPEQIAVINDAFVPDDDEVRHARELVAAFDGHAVVRVDDAMADAPHLVRARMILERAEEARGTA